MILIILFLKAKDSEEFFFFKKERKKRILECLAGWKSPRHGPSTGYLIATQANFNSRSKAFQLQL